MSYLLDALDKDADARDGQTKASWSPELSRSRDDRANSPKPWLWVLCIALLLNAALLALWLWWPASESVNTATSDTEASEQSTESRPPAVDEPYRPFSQLPAGSAAMPADSPTASSATPRPSSSGPRPTSPTSSERLRIETAPGERVIAPPGSNAIIVERPAQAGDTPSQATVDQPASDVVQPEPATPETADANPQPAPATPAIDRSSFIPLDQLDGATRGRFPEFSVSTHVYADDADLRAVVVDRQRLLEGDEVAGLPLAHITPTGVVVRFEGKLIEVSVIDDWE